MAVLGLVEAFVLAGRLDDKLLGAAELALTRGARALDGEEGERPTTEPVGAAEEPRVLEQRGPLLALYKPPGWSVSVKDGGKRRGAAGTSRDDEEEEGDGLGGESVSDDGLGRPLQEWVKETLGAHRAVARDAGACHGIVHRLDRDTSGVLLCASSYEGYARARLIFAARRVTKEYVCLCHGLLPAAPRNLDTPLLAVGSRHARKSVPSAQGRPARTEVLEVAHLLPAPADEGEAEAEGEGEAAAFSLVAVRLHSGRLHQIRAHVAAEGCPVVGDPIYGARAAAASLSRRILLHAHRLRLGALPGEGASGLEAAAPLPEDLQAALAGLAPLDARSGALLARWMAQ